MNLPNRITELNQLNPCLQPEIRLIKSLLQDYSIRELTAEEHECMCELMHMKKYNYKI